MERWAGKPKEAKYRWNEWKAARKSFYIKWLYHHKKSRYHGMPHRANRLPERWADDRNKI
jgi:hypothetical protein